MIPVYQWVHDQRPSFPTRTSSCGLEPWNALEARDTLNANKNWHPFLPDSYEKISVEDGIEWRTAKSTSCRQLRSFIWIDALSIALMKVESNPTTPQ